MIYDLIFDMAAWKSRKGFRNLHQLASTSKNPSEVLGIV